MKNRNKVRFLNDFYFGCRFAAIFAVPFLTLLVSCVVANIQKASAVIDAELYHLEMTTPEYVNIDVHPDPNGSIAIGASNISITSTTPGGFGLYLSGGNTLFRNGDNTITDADKKIVSTTGTYSLPTALISNSTTPATWGYAVAGLGNFDESYSVSNPSMSAKFAAVPATNSEQLIKTESSTVSNDTTTIYYGINANTNLTSGEYISGAVSYYSVADISSLIGGELTVSPNFITPGQENTITITTSLNTQMDVGTVNVTVGSYSCTSQTITSTTPLTISCTLPATVPQGHYDVEVNVPRFGRNYASENALHVLMAMQNINSEFVMNMNVDEQYQMYDLRDGKIYFVSKLQDGNVWMTQNLDFEVPTTGYTFEPETTYVSSSRTITPAATWGTDRNGYYYKDGGDVYYAPSGNFENNDSPLPLDNLAPDAEERHYSAGSYYSYTMASLGDSINGSETSYGYVDNFICPSGWIMPNYSYSQRYSPQVLLTKYGLIAPGNSMGTSNLALHQEPLYFARTGYYDGAFKNLGVYGGIWERYYNYAAQYQGGNISYIPYGNSLSFDAAQISTSSNIGMNNYSRREYGLSVRCVAVSPSRYTVHYDANGGKLKNSNASAYDSYASSWGTGEHGVAVVRSPSIAGRVGFTPIGFAETPDATEPQYYADDLIDVTQDKTLYVIWEFEPIYQAYHDAGLELNSDGYYTMQDMTPEICAAVPTPTDRYATISSRLQDIRDGKLYYVSKLLDGDCWMTQNLDFEIPTTGVTLSPDSSAVLSEKTIIPEETYSNMNSIVYYDGGDKNVYAGNNTLNEANYPDYDYNWHNHVGSYYTYNAATAGSGQTASSNAIESICPKGWRLPVGRVYEEAKSFGKLTEAYGYTTNGAWTNGTNPSGVNMQYNPLFLQLSGYYLSNGLNVYRGSGLYWSATSYGGATNPHAYYMSFSSNVNIAHSNEKYVGGSVRCVQGGPHSFTIHYDANGGNTAPADTTVIALAEATTGLKITNEKPEYGDSTFLGWATSADAITPQYAAGNNINVPLEGITLYAVWDPFDAAFTNAGYTKQNYAITPNNGEGKFFRMQDMTPEICAAVPTPTATATTPTTNLIDVRDNTVYLISKYADGNCWMTQNLDYRVNYPANEGGGKTLYPDTSDVSVSKRFIESNPQTADPHNMIYADFWDRQVANGNGALSYMTGIAHNGNNYRYHAGNLYSYEAAAMYFTDEDVARGYVNSSICPRGWTLPRLIGEQSFNGLISAYGLKYGPYEDGDNTNEPLNAPLYLTRAGQKPVGGNITYTGTSGVYWARTLNMVDDTIYAGALLTDSSKFTVATLNDLAVARSVRCVVKDNPEKLVTFTVNNPEYGELTESVVAVPAGTTFTTSGDTITFSNGITSQVKPKTVYGYFIAFDSWEVESGTITENTTIQANVRWHLAFNGIETMQEMTPEICAAAEENEALRPIDVRDGERYWITKLADGRCWMTEDLDFAIASLDDGGTTLDPSTSNVTETRIIGYDSSVVAGNINGYRRETYLNDNNELVRRYNNNDGIGYSGINGANTAFDDYRWHYRLGAFYGFNIATAGTGGSLARGSNVNVTESICPKGWHLPTANTGTTEYEILRESYDWAASPDNYTYRPPTYFYRNGYVSQGQSGVTDRGNYGQRWTANIDYNHYTNNTMRINPNTASAYNWAMGIRCIADAE